MATKARRGRWREAAGAAAPPHGATQGWGLLLVRSGGRQARHGPIAPEGARSVHARGHTTAGWQCWGAKGAPAPPRPTPARAAAAPPTPPVVRAHRHARPPHSDDAQGCARKHAWTHTHTLRRAHKLGLGFGTRPVAAKGCHGKAPTRGGKCRVCTGSGEHARKGEASWLRHRAAAAGGAGSAPASRRAWRKRAPRSGGGGSGFAPGVCSSCRVAQRAQSNRQFSAASRWHAGNFQCITA